MGTAATLLAQLIARGPVLVSATGDLAGKEFAHDRQRNIAGDEGLANGARQDQGELSPVDLLVLAHDAEQGCGIGLLAPGDLGDGGGQAQSGKMRYDARDAVVADMDELLG